MSSSLSPDLSVLLDGELTSLMLDISRCDLAIRAAKDSLADLRSRVVAIHRAALLSAAYPCEPTRRRLRSLSVPLPFITSSDPFSLVVDVNARLATLSLQPPSASKKVDCDTCTVSA